RVADVAQADELHALDRAPALHVEAGDQPPRQHPPPPVVTGPLVLNVSSAGASAWRSANPSALNAASTTWCRSSPRSTRTCSVAFAWSANERIQCSKYEDGKGPR